MSIFVDGSTNVLVQGITGWQGKRNTRDMLNYGTKVVAGVTPGKGGESVHGIPVYDTVSEAIERHDIDLSMIAVPPLFTKDATLEAIDAEIGRIATLAEGVPAHDTSHFVSKARDRGITLIGPNIQGVISPGKAKIAGPGGDEPSRQFVEGNIGILSRSGGMGAETAWVLKQNGYGVSTYFSIGGDPMIGSSFKDLLEKFETDDETHAVVMFGEIGTAYEEEAAEFIEQYSTKPVVAYIAGEAVENLPSGVSFGHAGAIIRGSSGRPSNKKERLREAGVTVVEEHRGIPDALDKLL